MTFESWEKQFNGHVELVVNVHKEVMNKAVRKLWAEIKKATPRGNPRLWNPPYWPKGYVPGDLKKAWKMSKLNIYHYVIYNELPYAHRIETGWSHIQAPQGMMRVTIKNWDSIVDKLTKEMKL